MSVLAFLILSECVCVCARVCVCMCVVDSSLPSVPEWQGGGE